MVIFTFQVKTQTLSQDIMGPLSKTGEPGAPMPRPEPLDVEKNQLPPGIFVPSNENVARIT
jgi:hypothetical protein